MRYAKFAGVTVALCFQMFAPITTAAPNDYVVTPTVEEGEREIDFKWGVQKNKDGTTEAATSLGLGTGSTPGGLRKSTQRTSARRERRLHSMPGNGKTSFS
jgi:hypothetical protein